MYCIFLLQVSDFNTSKHLLTLQLFTLSRPQFLKQQGVTSKILLRNCNKAHYITENQQTAVSPTRLKLMPYCGVKV